MASIDRSLQRNQDFAATGAHGGASTIVRHQVCVTTCLDPRTGPPAFLELDLGGAMVVRNAGGRVSADALIPTGLHRTIVQSPA